MTTSDEPPPSVSQVLGQTASRLRTTHSLKIEQVAKAVTARGLRWTPARVSELESGKVAATVSNLVILTAAFNDLLKTSMRLADWFDDEGIVTLTDEVAIPLGELREIVAGAKVSMPPATPGAAAEKILAYLETHNLPKGRQKKLWAIYRDYGEAEERAAAALGVDKETLCGLMLDLWGETLSARRDRIADPAANAQKRGRIARQLRHELEEAHHGKRQ